MKKNILAIATVVVSLFASCSKDSPVNDVIVDEKPKVTSHNVVFTINGIASQLGAFDTRSTSLPDAGIKHLEHWLYKTEDITPDMSREPLNQSVQTDIDAPIVVKNLASGNYTIIFFATDSDEKIKSTSQAYVDVVGGKYQMYSAKRQFVVKDENTLIREDVSLDRIIGKLEFVIEDLTSLPAEVQSITLVGTTSASTISSPVLLGKMSSVNLATGDALASVGSPLLTTIPRSDFAKYNKDNPISVYALPNGYNSSAGTYTTISDIYIQGCKDNNYYNLDMSAPFADENSKVVFMKKVGLYEKVKANKVTRFTGKIGNLGILDLGISFNEDWPSMRIEAEK